MTYCLGIKINKGLLFMSDTRTNAGVDNISTFKKIFTFNYWIGTMTAEGLSAFRGHVCSIAWCLSRWSRGLSARICGLGFQSQC